MNRLESNEKAIGYLSNLGDSGFWGFVTFKFEKGHVVHVRREENLKPHELPGTNRGNEDGSTKQ